MPSKRGQNKAAAVGFVDNIQYVSKEFAYIWLTASKLQNYAYWGFYPADVDCTLFYWVWLERLSLALC